MSSFWRFHSWAFSSRLAWRLSHTQVWWVASSVDGSFLSLYIVRHRATLINSNHGYGSVAADRILMYWFGWVEVVGHGFECIFWLWLKKALIITKDELNWQSTMSDKMVWNRIQTQYASDWGLTVWAWPLWPCGADILKGHLMRRNEV